MKWVSAISLVDDLRVAVDEVYDTVARSIDPTSVDLMLVFVHKAHRAAWRSLPDLLAERFPSGEIVGCSGGGTLGSGQEIEGKASLAVLAASLPSVDLFPFSIDSEEEAPTDAKEYWTSKIRIGPAERAMIVVFPDPFSCDAESLVSDLDLVFPNATVIGGLASGGQLMGRNLLIGGGQTQSAGAVGVAFAGNIIIDTIVAQGCRPIGNPMFVTSCDGQLVFELDGRPPAEALAELFGALSERDQELLQYSLFLGLVMREGRAQYDRGDFLIRNVLGLDSETGALIISADAFRDGQVVQFHVRDGEASSEDLTQLLASYAASHPDPPEGAILFSCLGRGESLYGTGDHDSTALLDAVGQVPLGGFFCNGEIGPVQGTTYVHGYTSVIGLFRSL